MPPNLAAKAELVGRCMLLPMQFLVAGLVALLACLHSVGAGEIGLRLDNWQADLPIGCVGGVVWAGASAMVFYYSPATRRAWAAKDLQRGDPLFWVSAFVTGVFAEELWRAFCLFALSNTAHSVGASLFLTAGAFAVAHRPRLGGALAMGIFGAGAAMLYLWRGSLVAPCSAHLVANLGSFYWIRRAGRP